MSARRLASGLCLLALLPATAAAATRLEDRDDSAGAVDFSLVRASHNRVSDELVWVFHFHAPLAPRSLLNRDGPPGSVCVNLWTTRTPREATPNYDVCVTAERRGRELRGSVSRHGSTGGVRRVGRAEVELRDDGANLVIRVDPDDVRRPRSFRWTAQATVFSEGCAESTGCEDFAPDRPGVAETRLRTRRR